MVNKNEEIFDKTLEQQLNTLRVDGGLRRRVLRDLRKLESEIAIKIAEIAPENASRFKATRLRDLLREVRSLIDADFRKIEEELREQLTELASVEATRQTQILSTAFAVGISTAAISTAKLNAIYRDALIEGAPSAEWWKRQSEQLKRSFEDQMRQGIILGDTNDQLVRRVRGTQAFGFTNGIMNTTRRNAEALVRSSVQSVANRARFESMDVFKERFSSYKHVSTLDSKTSERCIVRDGKRWNAETKEGIGHKIPFAVPPLHWNCRSLLVPELKGTRLPEDADRASIDGPVPANTSFTDFLERKGKAFQDEVLGKGKAELWRDGKIKLTQLLDQQGNPLTLQELKRKYDN